MDLGKHEFLSAYLEYVENTESPKICHLWAALSAASACLGRRCWYDTGIGHVWPNMYIILSGPPGGRKSSAINYARHLLEAVTTIRFAPDDTGGQRQGLIKAMTDIGEESEEEKIGNLLADMGKSGETFGSLTKETMASLESVKFDMRDPRTMYISASEIKSFLGENNSQMLTFLLRMFDGDSYSYELRNTSYEIKDGLLGIIGATTPSEIALMLPPGAMGSGFTSRIIFVHASGRNRRIPRPTLRDDIRPFLEGVYASIFEKFSGGFKELPDAARTFDDIYHKGTTLKDPRFMHYCERRHTHLQKTALAVAATRGQQVIYKEDMLLADQLLTMTEAEMPEAMGEFGMNKVSIAKQKLLEFVTSQSDPIPTKLLYSLMSRDMTQIDFQNTLTELHNGGKVTICNVGELGQCVIGLSENRSRRAAKEMDTIRSLLQGTGT